MLALLDVVYIRQYSHSLSTFTHHSLKCQTLFTKLNATSFDWKSEFSWRLPLVWYDIWHVVCDMWHVTCDIDTWHVACDIDIWHVACGIDVTSGMWYWHVTRGMWYWYVTRGMWYWHVTRGMWYWYVTRGIWYWYVALACDIDMWHVACDIDMWHVACDVWYVVYDMIYLLTAIGLTPGGSSTVHIYTKTIHRTTQNKQHTEQHKNFGRVRAVPHLCEFYPGIFLTTEEKSTEKPQSG